MCIWHQCLICSFNNNVSQFMSSDSIACAILLAASSLCGKGNAWRRYLTLQVSLHDFLSVSWTSLIAPVISGLNMFLFSCTWFFFSFIFRYTMFWVLLILTKVAFSFYIEVLVLKASSLPALPSNLIFFFEKRTELISPGTLQCRRNMLRTKGPKNLGHNIKSRKKKTWFTPKN